MRPRIRLSEAELEETATLRASGESWSAIARQLGVHRQIVQREYQAWERVQARSAFVDVRREALARELDRHLELLMATAEELVEFLTRPAALPVLLHGEPLTERWLTAGESPLWGMAARSPHDTVARRRRRRGWLLDALRSHTQGADWPARLAEMEKKHDLMARELRDLSQVIDQRWAQAGLPAAPTPDSWPQSRGILLEAILACCAEGPDAGKAAGARPLSSDAEHATVMIGVDGSAGNWSVIVNGKQMPLRFGDRPTAERCAGFAGTVLRDLAGSEQARRMAARYRELCDLVEWVAEQLDPLRLRPRLLQTRCALCPV